MHLFDAKSIMGNKKTAALRPQNSKSFWTEERKIQHGLAIKESKKYKAAIQKRPSVAGCQNPMWGKSHTEETKQKMSVSRTGKTGSQATAWKGGKTSLNRCIKKLLHTRHNWYYRVHEKSKFQCGECCSKSKLDAHHILPLSVIIKNLSKEHTVSCSLDNLEWFMSQSQVIDKTLENGISLCRPCHKNIHKNWGSHESKV